MNYQQAENFLLSLSNLPRKEYMNNSYSHKNALKRMQKFLDFLGNPENKIPHIIHIAGTSGKGSTATYLSYILSANGQKTGLMISPHITHLTERWQINNQPISQKNFVKIMEKIKIALNKYIAEEKTDPPSHFEVLTAIGFLYFAEEKTDWAVIEVGLGGRFDATNTLPKKDVAVITSIGLDHMELLGNTKEKIAFEKAGIILPQGKVFTCEQNKKVLSVIKKVCQEKKSQLYISEPNFKIIKQNTVKNIFQYKKSTYSIRSIGEHQIKNACFCIDIAESIQIPEKAIKLGLARAIQPLRMELRSKNPYIIMDGAHNPDKMETTIEATKQLLQTEQCQTIHLIIGFSADKNWKSMIKKLLTLNPVSINCTRNTVNPFRKTVHPKEIAEYCQKMIGKQMTDIKIFLDPLDAFISARTILSKHDILLVTGSIFLGGELRSIDKNIKKR
jgi:dihydrofolate synthase/folylpolyglutamate synthase